ncbi:MAG: IPT/TIG domain-containing protein [Solirubrobacteraceae bacterium]
MRGPVEPEFYTTVFIVRLWRAVAVVHGAATVSKAAPAVTGISPASGPAASGTTVTITGTDFDNASDVEVGNTPATSFTVDSPTQITAIAPPGNGTVDITVTTPGGTSATSDADQYTYIPAPSVTGIDPASGPTVGGTAVTITGTYLSNASDVEFGNTPATSFNPDGPDQITATAPAGTGTVDITVTTPSGTSSTSDADQYTYIPAPSITGVSPASGPEAGGTTVTITGTDLTGTTDVEFGSTPATDVSVGGPTQITATAPPGTGTVHVTVTTPSGTSATSSADEYSYVAPRVLPQTGSPTVVTESPTMHSSTALSLAGSVNPEGLVTTAHFEYGLDSRYTTPGTSGPIYDQSTPPVQIGSDFQSHPVFTPVAGLVPNALYHARLVATNTAGTTFGPDVTFTTPADPAPPAPKLASSFSVTPVSGLVLVQVNGKFVPLTQLRSVRAGAVINTLRGTLKLITATGKKHKTQVGTFGGAVFKVTQVGSGKNKGLATLALVEGAIKGGPSYAACTTQKTKHASIAAVSNKTLQLLHASDNHAKFRTKGRYSAATIRGTVWTIANRCDGTLVRVTRGLVDVTDFVRHITVAVHAGHSYLALAKPKKHK